MDKGNNIQMELTRKELQRNIEQITQEIQEVREEELRDEISTTVNKDAAAMLDEDLSSKMKKNKDIEIEREELRKKLDIL